MRIAVLTLSPTKRTVFKNAVAELKKAAESNGAGVDVYDCLNRDEIRLGMYEYIVVCTETVSPFSSRLSDRLTEALEQAGPISGKKGCALIVKRGLGSDKACRRLMKAMEKEGVMLDYFDIVKNAEEAAAVGKKL